jgi:hypothetical protein
MKWNCWNGPSLLGHNLPGLAHRDFWPEAKTGESPFPTGARFASRIRTTGGKWLGKEVQGGSPRSEGPNLGIGSRGAHRRDYPWRRVSSGEERW